MKVGGKQQAWLHERGTRLKVTSLPPTHENSGSGTSSGPHPR